MGFDDPGSLVKACREGDSEAWDVFLRRYGRLIWSIALRAGARESEAEEVFQRSWVAIVEGIGRVDRPERLHSWVAGVARNQTWRLFDEQRRFRRLSSLEAGRVEGHEPEVEASQEQDLLAEEAGDSILEALTGLDDRCRELLTFLFLEDPPLDYREISSRTGLAVGSIGPIRNRCLERLRSIYLDVSEERGRRPMRRWRP